MLVYALVSREKTVLAENTGTSNTSGNFEVIVRSLLPKLSQDKSSTRRSVDVESHTFHILSDTNGLLFIALADRTLSPKIAYGFLNEIRNRFNSSYKKEEWENAIAQSFNAEFSGVLSLLMTRYNNNENNEENNNGGDERIRKVKGQLEEVKDVMKTNIDSLLNRGERIELLVDTTERLTQASFKFQESATRLKDQHWWKSRKNKFILFGMFTIIIFAIVSTSCGGLKFENCF